MDDISLTTNGELLEKKAKSLFNAGLRRINISLDTLNEKKFSLITGNCGNLSNVLAGIHSAKKNGLAIKVNCLLRKNFTEEDILPLVEWAYGK